MMPDGLHGQALEEMSMEIEGRAGIIAIDNVLAKQTGRTNSGERLDRCTLLER